MLRTLQAYQFQFWCVHTHIYILIQPSWPLTLLLCSYLPSPLPSLTCFCCCFILNGFIWKLLHTTRWLRAWNGRPKLGGGEDGVGGSYPR